MNRDGFNLPRRDVKNSRYSKVEKRHFFRSIKKLNKRILLIAIIAKSTKQLQKSTKLFKFYMRCQGNIVVLNLDLHLHVRIVGDEISER